MLIEGEIIENFSSFSNPKKIPVEFQNSIGTPIEFQAILHGIP
jgi:hypothetical protein